MIKETIQWFVILMIVSLLFAWLVISFIYSWNYPEFTEMQVFQKMLEWAGGSQ